VRGGPYQIKLALTVVYCTLKKTEYQELTTPEAV